MTIPKLKFLFFFFLTWSAHAHLNIKQLQTGDILLVSLPCRVCQLIESEEDAPFSHMAVYITNQHGDWIFEVFGENVAIKPLAEFLDRTFTPNSLRLVMRHHAVAKNLGDLEYYLATFLDREYDSQFLWDNVDGNYQEKYYCSELIFKLYQLWLGDDFRMQSKPMSFVKNWQHWERYFQGPIPQGLPGVSPADFFKSDEFSIISIF